MYLSSTQNSWFGDSSATCIINNDDLGMFDFRFIIEKITGIGGQFEIATKVEMKKVLFVQANGKVTDQISSPVKYCSNAKTRFLSITSKMKIKGAKLTSNEQDNIILNY